MLIGVFHLSILVIALSFLLETFKRNLNPQLLMNSKSWIVTSGLQAFCSFLCFWESNPSIWNLSVYLEPASSKQYYFAQLTLEHFIRTTSTAWREIESVRVDAVILSSDVCCQETYACWSREHGSQSLAATLGHALTFMPPAVQYCAVILLMWSIYTYSSVTVCGKLHLSFILHLSVELWKLMLY